ncbi:phage holin family protein [Wenjunlia tyrosinilytica]|uniref:Membrane protein n=1 Tax=Wenjunlia tyrosinilytica TaxID=1544741 RepID=A0A917ZTV1_9ACTN|nr:phage holin family protein [Wenjunlia tyrosinilytica]GGO94962.1 membrane protein [Wenjunlia tyrosinilytica]
MRVLAVWAVVTAAIAVLAGVLPDFRIQSPDGDSPTRIAMTAGVAAASFGLLSALVWPLIVRALLLVPALVLGVLVFFLNGAVLLLALRLVPQDRGTISAESAVVIAAVLSAASSAANAWLSVYDMEAYRRRLARLAGRRRKHRRVPEPDAEGHVAPGTVFLQLDGLGHDILESAIEGRHLPTVQKLLTGGTHRLVPWRTDWSSQTGASQLAILHGSNDDVPAFRWYDKDTGRLMVCNRPTNAAELERRHDGRPGLLAHDGASRGNLFSGGAEQNALVLSVSGRPGRRSRSGYFAYFSDPANATRTFLAFVAEVLREIGQGLRRRVRDERPRVPRGGIYPFVRAFATVVERDVVVAAVMGDMLVGRTAVYADLVAYDEVAHHSGVRSPETLQVLRRLDKAVELITGAAQYAPRPYRFVLLSDHGQSQGETFTGRFGLSLDDLVRTGCGLEISRKGRNRAERAERGAEARAAARVALRRPEGEPPERPAGDPVVLASGNLGLVSFPDVPHRTTYEELQERFPKLLATLTGHPGIGFVLVRSEERGPLVIGGSGQHELTTGVVEGDDPLAPFGPGAAEAVLRTDSFPHVADVMVNSAYDPRTGEVHAFEEQIGSHGGLGGAQGRPFLLHPVELPLPPGGLVGAEAVHQVLKGWLEDARRPCARAETVPMNRQIPSAASGPALLPSPEFSASSLRDTD